MSKHHDVNDVTYTWRASIGQSKRKCSIKYGVLFSLNFTLSRADRNIKSQERFQFVATMKKLVTTRAIKPNINGISWLCYIKSIYPISTAWKAFLDTFVLEKCWKILLTKEGGIFGPDDFLQKKWKGVFFACYSSQLQNTRVISVLSVQRFLHDQFLCSSVHVCFVFFFQSTFKNILTFSFNSFSQQQLTVILVLIIKIPRN